MPWYFPWSDSIKKRASRYLLQHYLGQFLKEKLTLEQLSLDIYNGKGTIQELTLDVESLNASLDTIKVPLEVVDGFLGEISVCIPWSSLLTDSTTIEISNLEITLQTKKWPLDADLLSTGLDTMFDSMTSSIRMAEECLRDTASPGDGDIPCAKTVSEAEMQRPTFDGLEMFAKTIEAVLSRVKISLVDTVVRLEHVQENSKTGIALELTIKRIDYFDDEIYNSPELDQNKPIYTTAASCLKNFRLHKAQLYFDEFTVSTERSLYKSTKSMSKLWESQNQESTFKSMYFDASGDSNSTSITKSRPIKVAVLKGQQEVKLRIRQNHDLPLPKIHVDCQFGVLHIHLSPSQLHHIIQLFSSLTEQEQRTTTSHPMVGKDYAKVEQLLMDESVDIDNDDQPYYNLNSPDTFNKMNFSPKDNFPQNEDISGDMNHVNQDLQLKLKISFISAVLLHEDPSSPPGDLLDSGSSLTSKTLENIAESYFARIESLRPVALGQPLQEVSVGYSQCCRHDHICLIGKPFTVEMEKSLARLKFDVDIGDLEIDESVFDRHLVAMATNFSRTLSNDQSDSFLKPHNSRLLSFLPQDDDSPDDLYPTGMTSSVYSPVRSCIRLNFSDCSHPTTPSNVSESQECHRPSLFVAMRPCECEIDISIVDRVHQLLNPQPLCSTYDLYHSQNTTNTADLNWNEQKDNGCQSTVDDSETQSLELKVTGEFVKVILRFPIPDLRTNIQGIGKPWWRRNIHPEMAVFDLVDLSLNMPDVLDADTVHVQLKCNQINGGFQTSSKENLIPIVKIFEDDKPISLTIRSAAPQITPLVPECPLTSRGGHSERSTDDFNFTQENRRPSPFSRHCCMYDNEELIIPNDGKEVLEYSEYSMNNSLLTFDLDLPKVEIELLDKPLFELLYNRLFNDLIIWQPAAPSPSVTSKSGHIYDLGSKFSRLKSRGKSYNYDSDSDSDETTTTATTFTRGHQLSGDLTSIQPQNSMAIHITIGHGSMICAADANAENHSEPRELRFDVDSADLTIALDVAGDTTQQEISIASKAIQLWCIAGESNKTKYRGKTIYQSNGMDNTRENALTVAMKISSDFKNNVKEYLVSVGIKDSTLNHTMCPTENMWIMKLIEFFTLIDLEIMGYSVPLVFTELHLHLNNCQVDYCPLYLPLRLALTVDSFSITSNIVVDSPVSVLRFVADNAVLHISNRCDIEEINLKNYIRVVDVGIFELILRSSNGTDKHYPKLDLRVSNDLVHIRTCVDTCQALTTLISYLAGDGDLEPRDTQPPGTPDIQVPTPATATTSTSVPKSVSSDSLTKVDIERVNFMMNEAMHESTDNNTDSSSNDTPTQETELFFYADETKDSRTTSASACPSARDGASGSSGRKNCTLTSSCDPSSPGTPLQSANTSSTRSSPRTSCSAGKNAGKPPATTGHRGAHVSPVGSDRAKCIDILCDVSDIEDSPDKYDDMADSRSNLADDFDDDEYCIIDYGENVKDRSTTRIKKLCTDDIVLIENYIAVPKAQTDQLLAPAHYPPPITKYTIDEISLVWHVYGGSDFKEVEVKSDDVYTEIKFSKTGSIEIPKNEKIYKSGRDTNTCIELHISKLRFQYDIYGEPCSGAPYFAQRSRQALLVSDLEVHDLLATSSINKLLYQYTSAELPRQSHSNMICVKAVQQQMDPSRNVQECSVKVSLQPLRLNIDQDALFFMKSFFTSLSNGSSSNEFERGETTILSSPPSGGSSQIEPVMQLGKDVSPVEDVEVTRGEDQAKQERIAHGIYVKFDELAEQESMDEEDDEEAAMRSGDEERGDLDSEGHACEDADAPMYFKNFIFSPDVHIRLDYHGKRVDMKEGTLIGLLVGLGQLNCSQLKLKRLHTRHGILGIDRLVHFIAKEWLEDIVKNQLPSILGGLGPMHSIIQLVKGVCDLVVMPIEQYKRDGRIFRGLRRGANSFVTCTAMSALDLTNRMVQCVQFIAELTYNMLSPGPSCQSLKRRRRRLCRQGASQPHHPHHQGVLTTTTTAGGSGGGGGGGRRRLDRGAVYPAGIYDGITNACHLVSEGVKDTASTFVQVAKDEHEIKGYTGAVGGVLRQIPSAIVQPVILATEATSCVLGGMKSQLLPSIRKDDQAKWKQVNPQDNVSLRDKLPE